MKNVNTLWTKEDNIMKPTAFWGEKMDIVQHVFQNSANISVE
jgi:hypothetical protein